jgi:dihydroorotate dehydrogenase
VEDAREKLRSGATLVQVYTAFIYQGPKLIRELAKSI